LIQAEASEEDRAYLERLTPLVQERLVVLSEAPEHLRFFYEAPGQLPVNELVPKKLDAGIAHRALAAARDRLQTLEPWDENGLEARLRALAEELELKTGDLFMTLRVAATGSKVSPPLFQTLDALGKDETLRRIDFALNTLEPVASGA
jgi:glutamyl-tRNA synthetase